MMEDLLSRVFEGSAAAMVLNLIETKDLDADELAELRRLIHRKAKEQQT
jgi:predicted transcriptional regulator